MRHVFISYVHENKEVVDKLCQSLTTEGITVWLDRNDIAPGFFWKDAIHNAISNGDFFVACFSTEYNARSRTYMNEELTLAIDELRQRHFNQTWFIPILLSGEVPNREIGAGKTLRDLQWIELNDKNWSNGIKSILRVILPSEPIRSLHHLLQAVVLEYKFGEESRLRQQDLKKLWEYRHQFTFNEDSIKVIINTCCSLNINATNWIQDFPEFSIQALMDLMNHEVQNYKKQEKTLDWICENLCKSNIGKQAISLWKGLATKLNLSKDSAQTILNAFEELGEIEESIKLLECLVLGRIMCEINVRITARKLVRIDKQTRETLLEFAKITSSRNYKLQIADALLDTDKKLEAREIIKLINKEEDRKASPGWRFIGGGMYPIPHEILMNPFGRDWQDRECRKGGKCDFKTTSVLGPTRDEQYDRVSIRWWQCSKCDYTIEIREGL